MKAVIKDKFEVNENFSGSTRRIVVTYTFGDGREIVKQTKAQLRKIFNSKKMKFVRPPASFSNTYVNLGNIEKEVTYNKLKVRQWIRYFFRESVAVLVNDIYKLFQQSGDKEVNFSVCGETFTWEALSEEYSEWKDERGVNLHKVLTGKLLSSFTYTVEYAYGSDTLQFSVGFTNLGSDFFTRIIAHEFTVGERPLRPIIIPINIACNCILNIFKTAVEDFANSATIKSGEYFFRNVLPKYIPQSIIEVR